MDEKYDKCSNIKQKGGQYRCPKKTVEHRKSFIGKSEVKEIS